MKSVDWVIKKLHGELPAVDTWSWRSKRWPNSLCTVDSCARRVTSMGKSLGGSPQALRGEYITTHRARVYSELPGPESGGAPLVFVYSGDGIPAYGLLALAAAKRAWAGRVVLLHSFVHEFELDGVECINFEKWYQSESFSIFSQSTTLDKSFRDGFWLHAVERFFILEQWARMEGVERFAHAELDAFFFTSRDICERLDKAGTGLFYPFGSSEHAGAVFLYVNNLDALARLRHFICRHPSIGDEMRALWYFSVFHPQDVYALPSHSYFEEIHPDLQHLRAVSPSELGGLIDIQSFGTWLLGQDPRNIPRGPQLNRFFFEGIGSDVLKALVFSMDLKTKSLSVRRRNERRKDNLQILILHVHCKNFRKVQAPNQIFAHVALSRIPIMLPLSPKNVDVWFRNGWQIIVDFVYLKVRKAVKGLWP